MEHFRENGAILKVLHSKFNQTYFYRTYCFLSQFQNVMKYHSEKIREYIYIDRALATMLFYLFIYLVIYKPLRK